MAGSSQNDQATSVLPTEEDGAADVDWLLELMVGSSISSGSRRSRSVKSGSTLSSSQAGRQALSPDIQYTREHARIHRRR